MLYYIHKQEIEGKGTKMSEYTEVINQDGRLIDFYAAVQLMDDDIRERLHEEMAPCTPQEFYNAYVEAHEIEHHESFTI